MKEYTIYKENVDFFEIESAVISKKVFLGYVPRYYAKNIYSYLSNNKYSALIKNLRFNSNIPDETITVDIKILFN